MALVVSANFTPFAISSSDSDLHHNNYWRCVYIRIRVHEIWVQIKTPLKCALLLHSRLVPSLKIGLSNSEEYNLSGDRQDSAGNWCHISALNFSIPGTRTQMYAPWSKFLLSNKKFTRFWISLVVDPTYIHPYMHTQTPTTSLPAAPRREMCSSADIGKWDKESREHDIDNFTIISLCLLPLSRSKNNVRCKWDCKRQVGGIREFCCLT